MAMYEHIDGSWAETDGEGHIIPTATKELIKNLGIEITELSEDLQEAHQLGLMVKGWHDRAEDEVKKLKAEREKIEDANDALEGRAHALKDEIKTLKKKNKTLKKKHKADHEYLTRVRHVLEDEIKTLKKKEYEREHKSLVRQQLKAENQQLKDEMASIKRRAQLNLRCL